MKGGQTPIHIQRWAPADYQQDEHVQLLLRRRSWATLTFYRQFMDAAFLAGGDLPADSESLAACVRMPVADVVKALSFCLGRLLQSEDGRIYQKRVRHDVAEEIEYRATQAALGREGGKAAGRGRPKGVPLSKDRGTPLRSIGPPAPSSAPAPAPAPSSSPSPEPFPEGDGGETTVPTKLSDEWRCPDCKNRGTLFRGNDGGSWFFGTKSGGCGARFKLDDPAITRQLSQGAQQGIRERMSREPPGDPAFLRGSRRPTAAETTLAAVRSLPDPEES